MELESSTPVSGDARMGVWHRESMLVSKEQNQEGFRIEKYDSSDIPIENTKSFISDKKKIFFDNSCPYYHLMIRVLDFSLDLLKSSDEKYLFLFTQGAGHPEQVKQGMSSVTTYLKNRFNSMGHDVEFIDDARVVINNFIINKNDWWPVRTTYNEVSEFLSEGLDYSTKPTKKLYLSRGKTTTFNGNINIEMHGDFHEAYEYASKLREEYKYKFSDRIDDESLIEEYFKTLGFKVVYPEDIDSYEDQLQLIASAKILASITSSSLLASLVMARGTSIVELSTPLNDGREESIHANYKILSNTNSKMYLSISNSRVASELIQSIEENPSVKAFLLS